MTQSGKGIPGKESNKTPQQVQNIKSLDLVRWIETQPDLAYLRDIAGNTPAQHDKTTDSFAIQAADPTLIKARFSGPLLSLRDVVWPSARSMRGLTYSSPRLESSCNTTAKVMAASTIWDGISTVPFIQFGLQGFFGVASGPAAWTISGGLMIVNNILGKLGSNRSSGSQRLADLGLLGFFLLSLLKTSLAGVGFEILINQDGIARRYSDVLAAEQIERVSKSLNELLQYQNPKYLQFKQACLATKKELEGVGRTDPKFDSIYRRAFGSVEEQTRLRSMSFEKKAELLANSSIEGECAKQDIQLFIDQKSADRLRIDLDRYKEDRPQMTSMEFLKKEFPSVYKQEFVEEPNGAIRIREGGTVIGQAFSQFLTKLQNPRQISELAVSLFWMGVSVVLSILAVMFIWSLSRNKEMIMSHSNTLLLTRNNLLQAYQAALPKAQQRRADQANGQDKN
jgi:hypothetical protein